MRTSRAGATTLRTATRALTSTRGYATKDEALKPNLGAARVEKLAAKDEKSAFRAQLYESTAERTKKERADRDRHARERQEGGGGRNIATTFGMFSATFTRLTAPAVRAAEVKCKS